MGMFVRDGFVHLYYRATGEDKKATIIAYANDFKLLMYLTLATIPLVFIIATSKAPSLAPEETHVFE